MSFADLQLRHREFMQNIFRAAIGAWQRYDGMYLEYIGAVGISNLRRISCTSCCLNQLGTLETVATPADMVYQKPLRLSLFAFQSHSSLCLG
jgi:hypothetical protein